jgi:hypothetical protein
MKRTQVWIQSRLESFKAEVELNVSPTEPKLPEKFQGRFIGMESLRGELIIHADREPDGSGPTMWFNGRKDGFRFSMASKDSNEFAAVSLSVNPAL